MTGWSGDRKLGELAEGADISEEDIRALLRRAVEVIGTIAPGPESSAWSV